MTIAFQNCSPKHPNKSFLVRLLYKTLLLGKFEGDLKDDNIFFSNASPEIPKKGIFGHRFRDFQFCRKQFEKLEGTTFNYGNSLSKFETKNTNIRHFQFQISGFLFLHRTLQLGTFENTDFKYENFSFKFHSETTQIKDFWYQI